MQQNQKSFCRDRFAHLARQFDPHRDKKSKKMALELGHAVDHQCLMEVDDDETNDQETDDQETDESEGLTAAEVGKIYQRKNSEGKWVSYQEGDEGKKQVDSICFRYNENKVFAQKDDKPSNENEITKRIRLERKGLSSCNEQTYLSTVDFFSKFEQFMMTHMAESLFTKNLEKYYKEAWISGGNRLQFEVSCIH